MSDHSALCHEHTDLQMAHNHTMTMYFHFDLGDLLLFKGLIIDSNQRLYLACLLITLASILVEALSHLNGLRCRCELRKTFSLVSTNIAPNRNHRHPSVDSDCVERDEESDILPFKRCCESSVNGYVATPLIHCELATLRRDTPMNRLMFALLYGIQVFLSLTLMLVSMTYNVYFILSIALGKLRKKKGSSTKM